MKKMKVEKLSKRYDLDEDLLYAAIGRGKLKSTRKGKHRYVKLTEGAKRRLRQLREVAGKKRERLKSLKKQLRLSGKIIEAKEEVIETQAREIAMLRSLNEELLARVAQTPAPRENTGGNEESREAPEVEEGYIVITPALFSQRMRALGFGIAQIKELIVTQVLEGTIDLVPQGLVIEEDFFAQFEKKSRYWQKRS